MPLCGATTGEGSNDSPLGRGKGRQALGWVVAATHPVWLRDRCRCASHPSREGIFLGDNPRWSHSAEPVESLPQRTSDEIAAYQACPES